MNKDNLTVKTDNIHGHIYTYIVSKQTRFYFACVSVEPDYIKNKTKSVIVSFNYQATKKEIKKVKELLKDHYSWSKKPIRFYIRYNQLYC